jgi:hypothetical protein
MENVFTLRGTLYSKDCRKVKNVKKPTEPDWEFYSVKIETKVVFGERSFTTIPELQLDKGVSYEDFEVGDPVLVDCYLFGKAINSTWYKTEGRVVAIRFAPLQNGETRKPRKHDYMPEPPKQTDELDLESDGLPF